MSSMSQSTHPTGTRPDTVARRVLLLVGVQEATFAAPPGGVHTSTAIRSNISQILNLSRSSQHPPIDSSTMSDIQGLKVNPTNPTLWGGS